MGMRSWSVTETYERESASLTEWILIRNPGISTVRGVVEELGHRHTTYCHVHEPHCHREHGHLAIFAHHTRQCLFECRCLGHCFTCADACVSATYLSLLRCKTLIKGPSCNIYSTGASHLSSISPKTFWLMIGLGLISLNVHLSKRRLAKLDNGRMGSIVSVPSSSCIQACVLISIRKSGKSGS